RAPSASGVTSVGGTTGARATLSPRSRPMNTPCRKNASTERPSRTMPDSRSSSPDRRTVLRGGLYTAAALPLGVTLASCATGGGGGEEETDDGGEEPAGDVDPDNPFGVEADATVDAVIFDGGSGGDYVEFAGNIFEENHEGSTVEVQKSNNIAQEL